MSDREFRLELDGTLLTTRGLKRTIAHSSSPDPLNRILGLVDEGKTRLTLERCDFAGQTDRGDIFAGNTVCDRYWPRVVCVGDWYASHEALSFDKALVWLSSLLAINLENHADESLRALRERLDKIESRPAWGLS